MISIFGITIMSTKTRLAYRDLANRAYLVNQALWYTDDYCPPANQKAIRALGMHLSEAISHVPASDIDQGSA